jgi:hypothetical protein
MQIRIVSDGTPAGTHVTDVETGELIDNVIGIQIQADLWNGIQAWIQIENPILDLTTGNAEILEEYAE